MLAQLDQSRLCAYLNPTDNRTTAEWRHEWKTFNISYLTNVWIPKCQFIVSPPPLTPWGTIGVDVRRKDLFLVVRVWHVARNSLILTCPVTTQSHGAFALQSWNLTFHLHHWRFEAFKAERGGGSLSPIRRCLSTLVYCSTHTAVRTSAFLSASSVTWSETFAQRLAPINRSGAPFKSINGFMRIYKKKQQQQ